MFGTLARMFVLLFPLGLLGCVTGAIADFLGSLFGTEILC
jgi:hypothetical protein